MPRTWLKIIPQPVLHLVVIPDRVQKNIIGSDCEHDPKPQTNANFKDAGMKSSDAGARMLMRVADDAAQSSDGCVNARLVGLGNFLKTAQVLLVRVNGHAFRVLNLPDLRAATSLPARFSAIRAICFSVSPYSWNA